MSFESNESSPRGLHWILMIVAIIVVIVLFIILTRGKEKKKVEIVDSPLPVTPELIVSPNEPLDWVDTNVGELREAEFTISANTRVQVTGVNVVVDGDTTDAAGISAVETCTNENTIIDADMPCSIRLKYQPENPISMTTVDVAIKWSAFDTGVEIDDQHAITVIIGAREISKPEPLPEPVYEPDPIFDMEPTYDFQEDVEQISPEFDFDDGPAYDWPEPVAPVSAPTKPALGSGCSEFSFPGYNISGVHSGWIKPSGGAYYYHPFSDVNCESPTGVYNPDTGYVMDISNPARRIGSDAEHIRIIAQTQLPNLGERETRKRGNRARQLSTADLSVLVVARQQSTTGGGMAKVDLTPNTVEEKMYLGSGEGDGVFSTMPYDRTFVLRQYKPIPATIVSDIQADAKLLQGGLPVRATVDRNVYSDNGRTVIIPTGTLMLGYVTGELPGPYKAVGRMEIKWYQFIRPDGVEFNFDDKEDKRPFSADSQGRKGVPGHGSTDYLQQFIMPMLTAIVPAAVNLIAPISDAFVNQIDLDNNTVVQSGTVRSSELAKNEIITAWNNVATKLLVDVIDNTTPPFSIAAGTRITVFSPVDLFVTCGDPETAGGKKCAIKKYKTGEKRADWRSDADKVKPSEQTQPMEELIGQVRSMMQASLQKECCEPTDGTKASSAKTNWNDIEACKNYSFVTLDFYCRSFGTYDAINNAKQEAVFQNQQQQMQQNTPQGSTEYNTQVLGLEYNADGTIKNPFKKETTAAPAQQNTSVITCDGGANPDANGCCPGETYTDMGDQGFNCCPNSGGDCFPPIVF